MLRASRVLLALLLVCGSPASLAETAAAPIVGAGAHFSWVIFDELKPRLEKELGREIQLYGREAMLGAGCNAGIKSAAQHGEGMEAFGFVCCPMSSAELEKTGLRQYPLALEPILILVNQDNPVEGLTSTQVRQIFRGDIGNWKEVGGNDEVIVIVTRLHCKNRPGHWKTILKSDKEFSAQRFNVQSAADMVIRLNDFKTAIGHTGAVWKFAPTDRVKALKIDGYAPTSSNLAAGNYPFYRVLSAVVSNQASADVVRLVTLTQQFIAEGDLAERLSIVPTNEVPPDQIP